MRAFHINILKFAFVLTFVAQCARAAEPYAVTFQQGIEAKMRDGATLGLTSIDRKRKEHSLFYCSAHRTTRTARRALA